MELVVHRRPVATVAGLLVEAGLAVHARLVREPEGEERSPQACLFARR